MLTGRSAVVTGAAGGIGRAIAVRLAEAGVAVHAWDIDDKGLGQTVRETAKRGEAATPRRVDVTRVTELEAGLAAAMKSSGRLDIWINNAGIAGLGLFHEISPETFSRVIDVNLKGLMLGTRLALDRFESQGGGTIVNMASVAGFLPAPFMATYAATKFAVVGFTRALREELKLRSSAVKLCLVAPGFVDTGMLASHENIHYPQWLRWALSPPDHVARRIVSAVARGEEEIFPTLNGRLMLLLNRYAPGLVGPGTKLLLTDGLKGFALNRLRS